MDFRFSKNNEASGNIDQWVAVTDAFDDLKTKVPCSFHLCGNSMYPFARYLKDEVSTVRIYPEELKAGCIKQGDILLLRFFSDEGKTIYLVHRLIKLSDKYIVTMGDGNLCSDSPFPYECIIGRVTHIKRGNILIDTDKLLWRMLGDIWVTFRFMRFPLLKTVYFIGSIRQSFKHNKFKDNKDNNEET